MCVGAYAQGSVHTWVCMLNGAHLHLQACVHVVSLWKTLCYHGNTEQSIQRERERNWGAGLSLALHQLGILTR